MMSLPSSSVENLPPRVIKRVTQEVLELAATPPEGVKVYVNEEELTDIQAVIEGPGFFLTKIFHPNVAKNGAICVNTLKRDWKPEHGLKHILLTVKCLLIYPNPESALNEEAGKLLQEHYEDYFSHAQMMTDIHARPPRRAALLSTRNTCSTSGAGSGSSNSAVAGRKRPVEREGGAIDKKKKDKKKALKRL